MRLLFIFLILSYNLFSQTELKLDNNFTGILSTNTTTTFGFNYVGNNSLDIKKLSLDFSTNYAMRFSPILKENEFIQRANIGYEREKWDAFVTYQYNYSLIRKIEADNWLGIGGGVKFKYSWGKLSFSYATIYQNSNYLNMDNQSLFRHSLRARIKLDKKNISFSSEYFIQPSYNRFDDIIIYGTSKLSLFTNKPFNFIIQDVINYRSTSDVKLIHNLSLGVGYKFNKVIKKKG
jgi:hypothetical protein